MVDQLVTQGPSPGRLTGPVERRWMWPPAKAAVNSARAMAVISDNGIVTLAAGHGPPAWAGGSAAIRQNFWWAFGSPGRRTARWQDHL